MTDIDLATRGRDYHNEILAERNTLRADVERLSKSEAFWRTESDRLPRDRDYWQNIRARPAERELAAAERKLAMAVEALEKARNGIAVLGDVTKHLGLQEGQDAAAKNIARIDTTLAALEKNDE